MGCVAVVVVAVVAVLVVVVDGPGVEVVDLVLAGVDAPAAAFIQAYFPVDKPAA